MERRCCVCNKYLGEKEGPADVVSHGFCEPCLKIQKDKMMAEFDEFDKSEIVKNTFGRVSSDITAQEPGI